MKTKTDSHTQRDFIDFLLLLYRHQKKFFLILILFCGLAFFFTYKQNPIYDFKMKVSAPSSNDVFMPIIMYRNSLRKASNNPIVNEGNEFSSKGVNSLLRDLLIGGRIFPIVDKKLSNINKREIKLRDFLTVERKNGLYEIVVETNDRFVAESIHDVLIPTIELEIKSIYGNIIDTHKRNTLGRIQSLIKTDTVKNSRELSTEMIKSKYLETNTLAEKLKKDASRSPFHENYDYVEKLKIPKLDLNYIYFVKSDISISKPMPSIFVYFFSIFASIFLFIFLVIIIDLKNQVFLRNESNEKQSK